MIIKGFKKFWAVETVRASLIIFLILLMAYAIPPVLHRSQNPILQRSGLSAQLSPGLVSGQNTIDPNDGFTSQALGHRAAESWLSGDVPYWNHYEGIGSPLAGESQSAALSPFTILLHFSVGFVLVHFLFQLIAGIATYLFLRKLKLRFSIALFGGLAFALSGSFAWLTNAPFNPIAFLPLLMLGVENAVNAASQNNKKGWLLLALAIGLSLYSGFPEGAYINAIFAYGWAAIRLTEIKSSARKAYLLKLLSGGIVGILIAGPMLVAFAGYLPYGLTGGHAGGGYANGHLPISTLPALFMPYIYGPIFGFVNTGKPLDLFLFWSNVGGFITIPLLFMSLFAMYSKMPKIQKIYLGIAAAVVALKIYGFKPVAVIINAIPGMNQVAFYRYSIPVLAFSLIVLAAFGVDSLFKNRVSKNRILIITLPLIGFACIQALFARHLLHQLIAFPSHKEWALMSVIWPILIIATATGLYLKTKLRTLALITLVIADSFLMFIVPLFSIPKMSAVDLKPITFLQHNLGQSRFYTLHPIQPNYGSYYAISSININDLPVPKNYAEYITNQLDENTNPLVFTGYSRNNPAGPSALQEFSAQLSHYQNLGVKYLVTDPNEVPSDYAYQHQLKKVFHSQSADIYEVPDSKPYFETNMQCRISKQNFDEATINCPQSASVIRRELYIPGWTVNINGKAASIQPSQKIFQKVSVPKGESRLHFNYSPPHILIGYIGFIIGAGAMLLSVLPNRWKLSYLRANKLK